MANNSLVDKLLKLIAIDQYDFDHHNDDDDYDGSERFDSEVIMTNNESETVFQQTTLTFEKNDNLVNLFDCIKIPNNFYENQKPIKNPTTLVESNYTEQSNNHIKNIETKTHSTLINNTDSISINKDMSGNKQQSEQQSDQTKQQSDQQSEQQTNTNQLPTTVSDSDLEKKMVEPEFLTYDHLLVNLKLLGRLGKDEKLLNNFGNLDIDNRYLPTFRRWFTSDSRTNTFDMLRKITTSADHHSELLIDKLKETRDADVKHKLDVLTSDIIAAQTGFRNLIITYRDDESFLSKLDLCVDALSMRKSKNLNFK